MKNRVAALFAIQKASPSPRGTETARVATSIACEARDWDWGRNKSFP
jgi:hypothetical protein